VVIASGPITDYVPIQIIKRKDESGEVKRDAVVIFEVMAEEVDRAWWSRYRGELERRFRQEKIVARATEFEEL
jgi:hypothetical protein